MTHTYLIFRWNKLLLYKNTLLYYINNNDNVLFNNVWMYNHNFLRKIFYFKIFNANILRSFAQGQTVQPDVFQSQECYVFYLGMIRYSYISHSYNNINMILILISVDIRISKKYTLSKRKYYLVFVTLRFYQYNKTQKKY